MLVRVAPTRVRRSGLDFWRHRVTGGLRSREPLCCERNSQNAAALMETDGERKVYSIFKLVPPSASRSS